MLKKEMSTVEYPYGFCGMPCALCTRFRTNGKSRCEGCSAGGYYTDVCKVNHCCAGKGLSHCGNCGEFPCKSLGKMGDFRDLDTGGIKLKTCKAIAENGFESWYEEYAKRAELLTEALEKYNDGRMKRFLCELFIKENLPRLCEIMEEAKKLSGTQKEIGKAFRELSEKQDCKAEK